MTTFKLCNTHISNCPANADCQISTALPAQSRSFTSSPSETTFGEVLEMWLKNSRVQLKGATECRYRFLISKHILPELGGLSVRQITGLTVNCFLANKLANGRLDHQGGLSETYVQSIMLIIKSALTFAASEQLCSSSCTTIKKPSQPKKEVKSLTHEAQHILVDKCLSELNETTIGILLSLYTGMRMGEICALAWQDVDFSKNSLSVRHTVTRINSMSDTGKVSCQWLLGEPKTLSSKREIPLTEWMVSILKQHKRTANSEYVVSKKEGFTNPRTFEYRYQSILQACQIPPVNYHVLRHTFATRCIEAGVDIKSLSEILGHANASTTWNIYVHSSMEQKRSQLEKLPLP